MDPDHLEYPSPKAIQHLDEAFAFFESRTNLEKGMPPGNPNRVYRLDRMRSLCTALENPQDSFRTIHLAGSKGKGSTGAYIAAILTSAGRRVGVYASPHLVDYRERFRIEGQDFPEELAFNTAEKLLKCLPGIEADLPGEGGATTFELLTLFAFLLFRDAGCDTAVLETGLGGRLDATNVISSPEAMVFTPIEKEHTEILGNRLKDIAEEKAGIMKEIPGAYAFSSPQHFTAMRVIRKKAVDNHLNLYELTSEIQKIVKVEETEITGEDSDIFVWNVQWKNGAKDVIQLKMGGKVQAENASLALLIAGKLEPVLKHGSADQKRAVSALAKVTLPGRFQFLRHSPAIVLDGAHTPRSVVTLAEAFLQVCRRDTSAKPILLFGSVEGKDHKAMAQKLCGGPRPFFSEVIISTPGFFKPSSPAVVAGSFQKTAALVTLIPDPVKAWEAAMERAGDQRPILITGSFFMAGEIAALSPSLNE